MKAAARQSQRVMTLNETYSRRHLLFSNINAAKPHSEQYRIHSPRTLALSLGCQSERELYGKLMISAIFILH